MKKPKQKRKMDKRKRRPRSRPQIQVFQEYDESDYLREVLGHTDVALWVDKTPLYGRPTNEATIGDERVTFQPEIAEEAESERQKNSSRQFKRFWASLTLAQKEALRMVYVNNPNRLTKVEVAELLGIRVDTLQERIDFAVKKLKRYFPEFEE